MQPPGAGPVRGTLRGHRRMGLAMWKKKRSSWEGKWVKVRDLPGGGQGGARIVRRRGLR